MCNLKEDRFFTPLTNIF